MNIKIFKNILFICGKTDLTADLVLLALKKYKNIKVNRLNVEDFPTKIKLTASSKINQKNWAINFLNSKLNKTVNLEKITSVYYRPHKDPLPSREIKSQLYKNLIKEQSLLFIEWLEDILDCFWLNPPRAINRARSKILQLKTASEFGLSIPDSLITNNPEDALKFYNKHRGNIAVKLLQATPSSRELPGFIFTRKLTEKDIKLINQVAYSPVFFQEYIPKSYEIRATLIGNKVFSAKIESQSLEETKYDWRSYEFKNPPPHTVIELPKTIRNRLIKVNNHLGLSFAAYDLIVKPNGQYVFLELNANGQWGWIEQLTNLPISVNIAKTLIKRKK